MTPHAGGGGRRWRRAALLLGVVVAVAVARCGDGVHAQRIAVEASADRAMESAETSGYASSPGGPDDENGLISTHTVKTKVTITRTRVAAVVGLESEAHREDTRGKEPVEAEMPVTASEIETCGGEADGQCVAPEAESMPPVADDDRGAGGVEDVASEVRGVAEVVVDADGGVTSEADQFEVESAPEEHTQVEVIETIPSPAKPRVPLPDTAALNVAAKHLKELEEQLRVLLPQLKEHVETVASEMQSAYSSVVETVSELYHALEVKCVAVCREVKAVYGRMFADVGAVMVWIYGEVAAVSRDVYTVVSAWVIVVAVHTREIWQTYEEIRIMTHHFVSVCLLGLLGGIFFAVYGLIATVPVTLASMYNSLDDLTRAQIKIVAVLVFTYTFYQLRVQWTFWVAVALAAIFYYWSGHVVKAQPPLQRQPSRSAAPVAHPLKPASR